VFAIVLDLIMSQEQLNQLKTNVSCGVSCALLDRKQPEKRRSLNRRSLSSLIM
jgi:hypothetical protein